MSSRPRATLPLPGVRWRGLTVQLFVTVVLPLTGLLIAVAVGAAYLHQRAMRDLVGERDHRAAVFLARALEEQLEHRGMGVQQVRQLLALGASPAQALRTAAYLRTDLDVGLAVLDAHGQPIAATPADDALWRALLVPPVPQPQAASPEVRFSTPRRTPDDQTAVLVVAPRLDAQGWVVGAFRPQTLAHDTLQGAFEPQGQVHISLLSAQGQPLFTTIPHASGWEPVLQAARQRDDGVVYTRGEDGEHVLAFRTVQPVGWLLVVEENWAQAANPWLHTTQLAPLLLVPILLLALVALWFGARQVVEPLQHLEAQAAALAWGRYDALDEPVTGIEEIQRLQRTLRHMARKVQRAQQALHNYIGVITQAQEEERRRLARELHDETLQALIALQQRVLLLRQHLHGDPDAQRALNELQSLLERTMRELRRTTHNLRPLYLEDLGLVPALETLAREIQNRHPDLQVEVLVQGPVARLEPEQELALYRIAQEALQNIVRHAQATWAQVRLVFGPRQVRLEVQDNGRGFRVPESPAEFAPQGHYGLLGMYERAELIGARLTLHSEPGQGTRVVLTLPRPSPDDRATP